MDLSGGQEPPGSPRTWSTRSAGNAAFAYLDPVRAHPNLTIKAETLVDRIVFDGTRPAAMVARGAEGEQRVPADTVVIAAGAYMSPAILQRSGIGPEDELARLGITAVAPLPGVGQNLLEHPWVGVSFTPTGKLDATTPDLLPNVMLKAPSSRCRDGSWDTHVLPRLRVSSDGSRLEVTFHVFAVESDSAGRVRLLSTDPEALPVLEQPFSDLSDHDVGLLVEGIELVRRLAGSTRPRAVRRPRSSSPGPSQIWRGGRAETPEATGTRLAPAGWDLPGTQAPSWMRSVASTESRAWSSPTLRSFRRSPGRTPTFPRWERPSTLPPRPPSPNAASVAR